MTKLKTILDAAVLQQFRPEEIHRSLGELREEMLPATDLSACHTSDTPTQCSSLRSLSQEY